MAQVEFVLPGEVVALIGVSMLGAGAILAVVIHWVLMFRWLADFDLCRREP